MSYSAKIVADSLSPDGVRLTTMEVVYPRFIHSEMMTHRVFSRNAESSRAVPTSRKLEQIESDPVIPSQFSSNKAGMQAGDILPEDEQRYARQVWKFAKDFAVMSARDISLTNVHKQWANRLTEPFAWIKVLISSTEWKNFFALRTSGNAQPEMQEIATLMLAVYKSGTPQKVEYGDYHLPYIDMQKDITARHKAVSVARCARVSYLTHDGHRNVEKDLELYTRLLNDEHASPFEHVATPVQFDHKAGVVPFHGNFRGWYQFRKELEETGHFLHEDFEL